MGCKKLKESLRIKSERADRQLMNRDADLAISAAASPVAQHRVFFHFTEVDNIHTLFTTCRFFNLEDSHSVLLNIVFFLLSESVCTGCLMKEPTVVLKRYRFFNIGLSNKRSFVCPFVNRRLSCDCGYDCHQRRVSTPTLYCTRM